MELEHVRHTLGIYLTHFPADKPHVRRLEQLLDLGGHRAPIARQSPAHITTGAVLVDVDDRTVLQIRHRHLERWLLPGGHVEPSDHSLPEAAHRELTEETGEAGRQASLALNYPLDIDVHLIPERPDRGEAEHLHFDFRFVFTMSAREIELASDEVEAFRWATLDALGPLGQRVGDLFSND